MSLFRNVIKRVIKKTIYDQKGWKGSKEIKINKYVDTKT